MVQLKSIFPIGMAAALLLMIGLPAAAQTAPKVQKVQKKNPRFILSLHENMDIDREGGGWSHDHLSLSLSLINQKKNHHEISINNLSFRDQTFFLGAGYQYKWQMLKRMIINPYVGLYNDVNYSSQNLISSSELPQYQIMWEGGFGPGINSHIGRLQLDLNFRIPLIEGIYSHAQLPGTDQTTVSSWDMSVGTFKRRFALRLGVGFRF